MWFSYTEVDDSWASKHLLTFRVLSYHKCLMHAISFLNEDFCNILLPNVTNIRALVDLKLCQKTKVVSITAWYKSLSRHLNYIVCMIVIRSNMYWIVSKYIECNKNFFKRLFKYKWLIWTILFSIWFIENRETTIKYLSEIRNVTEIASLRKFIDYCWYNEINLVNCFWDLLWNELLLNRTNWSRNVITFH